MSEPTPRTDRETYTVKECDIGFKVVPVSCAVALEQELNARKGDPTTRLHNICAALEEDKGNSPYTAEAWDQLDAENQNLRRTLAAKLSELERISDALGTNEGHSSVDHIVAMKAKMDAQRTALLAVAERIRREGMQGVANAIEEIVK